MDNNHLVVCSLIPCPLIPESDGVFKLLDEEMEKKCQANPKRFTFLPISNFLQNDDGSIKVDHFIQ